MSPKEYYPTFIFEFESDIPFTKSMTKKLNDSDFCDNLDMTGRYKGKITTICKAGYKEFMIPELLKNIGTRIELLLQSCSKNIEIYNYKVFLT